MKKDWFIVDIQTEQGIVHTSAGDFKLKGWNIHQNGDVRVSFYDKDRLLKPLYEKTAEPLCTINGFYTTKFDLVRYYEPTGLVNIRFAVVKYQ